MKSNKQLELSKMQNKLLAYSAVAGVAVVGGTTVNAGTVHETVGVSIENSMYSLDINNDGIDDFFITHKIGTEYAGGSYTGYASGYCSEKCKVSPEVIGVNAGTFNWASALAEDDVIGGAKNFNGDRNWLGVAYNSYTTENDGPWLGTSDKYLGVVFGIGKDTHYGWIQLSVPITIDSVTIVAFAYETVANTAIAAGDTTGVLGVETNRKDKLDIYSFGRNIHVNSTRSTSSVNVYDMLGKEVYAGTLRNGSNKIELQGTRGMHIVKVGNTTKKVFID